MANLIINGWKDGSLSDMIIHRYRISQGFMGTHTTRARNLIDMYRCGHKRSLEYDTDERDKIYNADESKSVVRSSIIYNAVETVTPRLMSNFNPEGFFNFVPYPYAKDTTLDDSLKATAFYQRQLDEMRVQKTFLKAVKQTVKLGWAAMLLRWESIDGIINERELIEKGRERWVERSGKIYDAPRIELIPYFNFYPDPKYRTIEEGDYTIIESVLAFKQLEARAEMEMYNPEVVAQIGEIYGKDNQFQNITGGDVSTEYDRYYSTQDPYRKDVRILTYYENDRIIHVAMPPIGVRGTTSLVLNDKPEKQENPNDFNAKPIVMWNINVDEDDMFPQGVIEPLRDDDEIQSTFLNMGIDALRQELNPMKIVDENLQIDIKELQGYMPDKIILASPDDMIDNKSIRDRIYEFKPDPNGLVSSIPMMMQMTDANAEKKSGITSYLTGSAATGSNKTARGVAQLTQNAEVRGSTSDQVLAVGVTDLLDMIESLNQQHHKDNEELRFLYGDYDKKVFQYSRMDLQARVGVLQTSMPVLAEVGGKKSVIEAQRRIFKAAGEPAIEALLPNDGSMEQAQAEQGAGQVQEMVAQAQGGGNVQQS